MIKIRKWFFTIWKMDINWDELYEDYNDIIRYIVVQKEKGNKTGRLHWQGAIHFYNPKRLSFVRRFLMLGTGDNSGDLQPQRGTNKQVKDYCHKIKTSEGFQFEFGKPSQQGFRTDLEDIKSRIEKGEKDYHIAQDHFGTYSRAFKWAEKYRSLHLEHLSQKYRNIKVKFTSGPTGIGKTKEAYKNHDNEDIFKINCSDGLKWFDGYRGQKVLILDEFKNQVPLTRLLDLLDGYQCRLEYKGGMTYALWDTVYITTNLQKTEIYPGQKQDLLDPLWRRVTEFVNLYPKGHDVTKGNTIALVPTDSTMFSRCPDGHSLTNKTSMKFVSQSPPGTFNKIDFCYLSDDDEKKSFDQLPKCAFDPILDDIGKYRKIV